MCAYPCVAGNEEMEKKMETIIMGYVGTNIRIHSFILCSPKASVVGFHKPPGTCFVTTPVRHRRVAIPLFYSLYARRFFR